MKDHRMPRILNVDDNDAIRYTTTRILRRAGFAVQEAATGRDALRLAEEGPDLILLDVQLPDISGLEVCRQIKANPRTAAIPVVHLSATFVDADDQATGMEQGADGYLTHPVDPKVLVATVNAFLRLKTAEQALRESEELFLTALENSPVIVFNQDLELRYTWIYIPQRSQAIFTPENALGQTDADLFAAEDAACLTEIKRRILETGVPAREEVSMTVGGQVFFYDLTAEPLRDASGNIVGVTCVLVDITARKRVEKVLQRERTMLERTEGIAQIGSWEWDIATDTVTWSNELFRIFQRDPWEGAPSFAEHPPFYHPDDMTRLQQAVEAAVTLGTPYELELRAIRKDGETRICIARGVAEMAPGEPAVRLFGSFQDITVRRQAEEALRISEDQYRVLFEKMDEGFCVVEMLYDPDGKAVDYRFVEINPAFEKHTGLQQALGKTIRQMVPDHDAHWFEIYGKVARTGESIRFENPATAMQRYYDVFAFRIGGEGNQKVGIFFNDITERKLLEQTMEKARADFLFAVSHELKTPLHVMGTIQEMIESLPENHQLAVFLENRDLWRRNMLRLRLIIENLVDSQRPEGMGLKLDKRLVDLIALAQSVQEELRPAAAAREIRFRQIAEPLPFVALDTNAIRRLIENLLTNAVKFSLPGGEVWIELRAVEGMLSLQIRDFGMNIDPEVRPFLFQPFYRSPEAVKAGVQGTGLGLYVAKMIAEAHGGAISLESEPGKGTTVTVRLPLE